MRRVLFILENLNGGGAERVLPNLLKYIDRRRFDVSVLTLFEDGVNRSRIPDDIPLYSRRALYFRGITNVVKFCPAGFLYNYYIKKALPKDDFDVVIAYTNGLATKIASGADGKKSIAWMHGDMMGVKRPNFPRNFISRKSMLESLRRLDAIVGVSRQVCDSFTAFTGISDRVHLIHNTNDVDEIERKSLESNPFAATNGVAEIVTVGHLRAVKGNDLLIEAASKLKGEGVKFHVTILGEGDERGRLEALVREKGLSEQVSMPGFIENPYPYIKNADLYVCPSRSEGFSTAVSEALILGVPVVSTRVSGAEEMLGSNDEYGIVCDCSADGIHGALKKMITTEGLLKHYAGQTALRKEFFSPERTVGDVERLIEGVCPETRS